MLSGQQPYNADTPMGVVVKHITEPVPEILKITPSLPYDVDQIIKSSMAKDKNKRYATAVDLAKALNMVAFGNEGNLASTTNTGLRSGVYKTPTTQSSRGRTGLAVGGIVLVVAIVGFFLLRNQLFAPPPVEPTPTSVPTVIPSETPTEVPTEIPTPTLAPTLVPATETASACLSRQPVPLKCDPHSRCQRDEQSLCRENSLHRNFHSRRRNFRASQSQTDLC